MKDGFESKVRQQIERLKRRSCRAIEREVAEKRMPSPRRAYELLFFDYMGLSEDELPIVSEAEIVWLSLNKCSILEACKALGLDTRQVYGAVVALGSQFIGKVHDTAVTEGDPNFLARD